MSEYTPTTYQIREFWVSHGTRMPAAKAYTEKECAEEFDRWLNQVKAEIWDEAASYIDGCHGCWEQSGYYNPYKERLESES